MEDLYFNQTPGNLQTFDKFRVIFDNGALRAPHQGRLPNLLSRHHEERTLAQDVAGTAGRDRDGLLRPRSEAR
jgi:hypothetical protein